MAGRRRRLCVAAALWFRVGPAGGVASRMTRAQADYEAARLEAVATVEPSPLVGGRGATVVARFPGLDPARYFTILDAPFGGGGDVEETWLVARNGSWPSGDSWSTALLWRGTAAAPAAAGPATVSEDHSLSQNVGAAYAGGVFVVAGGEYHPPERPKWAPRKVQASRNRERRHGPNVGLRCFRGAERHPYEGHPDDAVRRRRFYDVRDRAAALAGRWGDRTALLPGTHGGAYRGVRARAFQ